MLYSYLGTIALCGESGTIFYDSSQGFIRSEALALPDESL